MANIEDIERTFLKVIKFKQLGFWDYKTYFKNKGVTHIYQTIKLNQVLTHRSAFITIDDGEVYKRCKVQLYSKGVVLRDEVKGEIIKVKRQQVCKPGEVLVAEIDAKFGGFGIVPDTLEGAIVSSHYFLFTVDENKVLKEYLELYFKTDEFQGQVQATGSTNYSAIRPHHFLQYEIPLPTIEEQKVLIDHYHTNLKDAEHALNAVRSAKNKIQSFIWDTLGIEIKRRSIPKGLQLVSFKSVFKWGLDYIFKTKETKRTKELPVLKITDLCKVSSGGTPSRSNPEFYTGDIPWVKTTEVINDIILDTEEKITKEAVAKSSAKLYPAGSLIIAMYGQGLTRGRTAKLGVDATTNQACAVLHNIDNNLIITDYLWFYLQNEYNNLRDLASGNNQPNLNAEMISNYEVIVPAIEAQQEIVNKVLEMKAEITDLIKKATSLKEVARNKFEEELFHADVIIN